MLRCLLGMLTSAALAVVAAGCGQQGTGQMTLDPAIGAPPAAGQDASVSDGVKDGQGDSAEEPVGQEPAAARNPHSTDDAEVPGPLEPENGPHSSENSTANQQPEASSGSPDTRATGPEEEPLLLLDDEPLLLLEDDEGEASEPTGPVADNSRCHVCHVNYLEEDIAVVHARANVGCADCHGECDEHIADESWASGGNGTAPDIMYPPEKILPLCLGCHEKDKLDAETHDPLFAGTSKEKVCTDCHGDHRLKERKCKWK